jgi:hypothetical protein
MQQQTRPQNIQQQTKQRELTTQLGTTKKHAANATKPRPTQQQAGYHKRPTHNNG